MTQEAHDVFLSYARENLGWVRQHLYEPLRKTRTAEGRPPRIFFDLGEDGIQIGQDFKAAIDNAIEHMHKFVPVYSQEYFQKDMCIYELELAQSRDMNFRNALLLPVLIDPRGAGKIPFAFRRLNYLTTDDPDWLKKLCVSLELTIAVDNVTLTFVDNPQNVFTNHTLPVVRVAATASGKPIAYEEEITLSAEAGTLLGTVRSRTSNGIATFLDLSVAEAVGPTRLVATAATAGKASSDLFSVYTPPPPVRLDAATTAENSARVWASESGEVVFFETGRHFAILQPRRAHIFGTDGALKCSESLSNPIRIVRRKGKWLALADWKGNIYRFGADGERLVIPLGSKMQGIMAPADLDFDGDCMFVAFWNGMVFRIDEQGKQETVVRDAAGIQVIGVSEDRLFTCDFAGNLRVYRQGRLVNSATLEPTLWLLTRAPSGLLGVGDRRFYHISSDGTRVMGFDMALGEVASVLESSKLPVVTDVEGKSIRFDHNLAIAASISLQPGAAAVSADDEGLYCTFRNRDGAQLLVHRDRIVYSQTGGFLAVNPQGDCFAISDGTRTELVSVSDLKDLIQQAASSSIGPR